jgi:hypothetical protein
MKSASAVVFLSSCPLWAWTRATTAFLPRAEINECRHELVRRPLGSKTTLLEQKKSAYARGMASQIEKSQTTRGTGSPTHVPNIDLRSRVSRRASASLLPYCVVRTFRRLEVLLRQRCLPSKSSYSKVKQFILEDGVPYYQHWRSWKRPEASEWGCHSGYEWNSTQENLSQRKRGPYDRLCNEPGRRILRQDPTGD